MSPALAQSYGLAGDSADMTKHRHDTSHFLFIAVALIAFLYSSVGHAGASEYIATMTLFGLGPAGIKLILTR
jgi:nitrate reductase NapE component